MSTFRFASKVVLNEESGPFKPGFLFLFSDNLTWQLANGAQVGGIAGTHSGTHRLLRIAGPDKPPLPNQNDDGVLQFGVLVFEYEATFMLEAVTLPGGVRLDAGQVTVRGIWYAKDLRLVDRRGQPLQQPAYRRSAVTGGTGPYFHVRGQGYEPFLGEIKTLELDDVVL
ncbi:hypothetical protein ACI797_15340 [Geodermatophilus sp. SYSU D00691]